MVRAAALDVGKVRVGVAVADELGVLAHPRPFVDGRDPRRAIEALVKLAAEEGIGLFLVGLPRQLSGEEGPSARRARRFAQQLKVKAAVDDRVRGRAAFDPGGDGTPARAGRSGSRSARPYRQRVRGGIAAVLARRAEEGRPVSEAAPPARRPRKRRRSRPSRAPLAGQSRRKELHAPPRALLASRVSLKVFVGLAGLGVLFVVSLWAWASSAGPGTGQRVSYEVRSGSSASDIAEDLRAARRCSRALDCSPSIYGGVAARRHRVPTSYETISPRVNSRSGSDDCPDARR